MSNQLAQVWYDKSAIDMWKMQTPLDLCGYPRRLGYRSNWRLLHIDGFESGYGYRTIYFNFARGLQG